MQMTGNTILITGGGSGIGRGLAEAFHKLGNQVIIAGRRQNVLDAVVAANPGIRSYTLDVENATATQNFVQQVSADFPQLNVLINNAGIMQREDLTTRPVDLSTARATLYTNIAGVLDLTAAFLPLLKTQQSAALMVVTSGLAFVPRASFPTYCASKAFLHSWWQSLRYQLRESSVEVLELVPPYTQTELTGSQQAVDPAAMPLNEYIEETMRLLAAPPANGEILVERVQRQRYAERDGKTEEVFAMLAARG